MMRLISTKAIQMAQADNYIKIDWLLSWMVTSVTTLLGTRTQTQQQLQLEDKDNKDKDNNDKDKKRDKDNNKDEDKDEDEDVTVVKAKVGLGEVLAMEDEVDEALVTHWYQPAGRSGSYLGIPSQSKT
jgi:hypothetical protein